MEFGFFSLTLVFSPMLMASIFLAIILAAFISFDGEFHWLEGEAFDCDLYNYCLRFLVGVKILFVPYPDGQRPGRSVSSQLDK